MYLLLQRRKKSVSFIVKYACRGDGGWWSSPPSVRRMFPGLFTFSHCSVTWFKVTFLLQNRKTPPLNWSLFCCLKILQIGCCKTGAVVITTFTIKFVCVQIEKLYIPTFTKSVLISCFKAFLCNGGILKYFMRQGKIAPSNTTINIL